MRYDPINHHRRSTRLQGRNYAQAGMYYVTILTHERECLFGEIEDGRMRLSETGEITRKCWMEIPKHFPNVSLDEFRVMPNHLHGIIVLSMAGTRHAVPRTKQDQNEQGKGVLLNDADSGELKQGKGLINQTLTKNQTLTDWPLTKDPQIPLGKIVRHFKAKTSKGIHDSGHHHFRWHRNYHDHIICDPKDLTRIRQYIRENPVHWQHDEENPENRE